LLLAAERQSPVAGPHRERATSAVRCSGLVGKESFVRAESFEPPAYKRTPSTLG
jgi:hypothetical protein